MPLAMPTNNVDVLRQAGGAQFQPKPAQQPAAAPAWDTSRPGSVGGMNPIPPDIYSQMYPGKAYPSGAVAPINSAGGGLSAGQQYSNTQAQAVAAAQQQAALLRGQYGGQMAAYNQANQGLTLQGQQAGDQYALAKSQAQTSADQATGKLNEQNYRDVDLGRQTNNAQRDYLNAILGLNQGQLASDQGYYNTQEGYAGQSQQIANNQLDMQGIYGKYGLDNLTSYLNQMKGYAGQTQDLGNAQAGTAFSANRRSLMSDATARGAMATPGVNLDEGDLYTQLGQAKQGNAIQYGSAMAGYNNQQTQAQTDYSHQLSDIDSGKQKNNLTYNQQMTGYEKQKTDSQNSYDKYLAGEQQQQKQADIQDASLDSLAKEYGISRDQIDSGLKDGLAKLGLDYNSTMAQITNAQKGNDAQQTALANMLMQQALSAAGTK